MSLNITTKDTIDVGDVITMLDLIIDDEDTPDLQIGHELCHNVDEAGRPMCIAGNLYTELDIVASEGGSVDYWWHDLERAGLTQDAIHFLANVQAAADGDGFRGRRPWRDALDRVTEQWGLA